MRKTKIIATLGPATESAAHIEKLLKAGVDVCRLNLSHGELSWHKERVRIIRNTSQKLNKPVSIILDIQGPRIRTGSLHNGKPVRLKTGETIAITTRNISGKEGLIATAYQSLPDDVRKGDRILLDDGTMELRVLGASGKEVKCLIVTGGVLKEHKGMNLPGVSLSVPSLTEKDRRDLSTGLAWGVDYVALSFVRSAKDVKTARAFIVKQGFSVPVIAKIEKPEAVQDIGEILDEADGVMLARGDLGVEMEMQKVPLIQKDIIKLANKKGKPVITATQMLESMISRSRPTRAEASDVANAILDGTDAVMLSGETSVGKYPFEAVKMMSRIAMEAEKNMPSAEPGRRLLDLKSQYRNSKIFAAAIAHAALDAAIATDAAAIIVYTLSGKTAQLISKLKPFCRICALTPEEAVYNRLPLLWGVAPIIIPFGGSTDAMLSLGEKTLSGKRLLKKGDTVVIVSGTSATVGATNMMKVHRIGEGWF